MFKLASNIKCWICLERSTIVREVFYAEDGSILGCTENEVSPNGRSLHELTADIEAFASVVHKPVLTLNDIPRVEKKLQRNREDKNNLSHEQVLAELGLSRSQAIG